MIRQVHFIPIGIGLTIKNGVCRLPSRGGNEGGSLLGGSMWPSFDYGMLPSNTSVAENLEKQICLITMERCEKSILTVQQCAQDQG